MSRNLGESSSKGAGRDRSSRKKCGQENTLHSLLEFMRIQRKKTMSKAENKQLFTRAQRAKVNLLCNEE